MSVDLGLMMHERDRKRAAQLFRTQSLGKNKSIDVEDAFLALGSFEPDWSKFESVYASDLLPNKGGHVATSHFLTEVVDILLDYIRKNNDRSCKVLDFHHPNTLKEMMGHCIDLQEEPQNLEQVLSDCKETLKYCVKTGHPRFFNQLSTGLDIIALAGEWLTATANTNMFTYEIAPVFTLMEDIVLTKMRELIGWSDGDGIFAPGGAISNLYAVAVARHKYMPDIKTKGMTAANQKMVLFTSEHAHFSIKRAGALLGLGTENVITIKTDSRGRMIVDDLEMKIEKAKSEGALPGNLAAG
jgi:glutamate decarboxylase